MKVGKGFSKGNSLFLLGRLMAIFVLAVLITLACPQLRSDVSAKTTITVNKIDQKTAKKVHKQLMKGKEFVLRFPGDEKSFYTKFQKLTKKVAKCTDYGFDVFPICMRTSVYFGISGGDNPKVSGAYVEFTIRKEYCQEYIYGIKFAKHEYKDFKAYVNKALEGSGYLCNALKTGAAYVNVFSGKSNETMIAETSKTIASLKKLKQYLQKTKFRNLSGAMKARIVLGVGDNIKMIADDYQRQWGKRSMEYREKGRDGSFKSLYKRKAGGVCATYARTTCATCAVFDIGEFDYLTGKMYGAGHAVARVKVRTLGGKTRYVIISNGEFSQYNDFVGFEISDVDVVCRSKYKVRAPISKIGAGSQLKLVELLDSARAGVTVNDDKSIPGYKFDLKRSEW